MLNLLKKYRLEILLSVFYGCLAIGLVVVFK